MRKAIKEKDYYHVWDFNKENRLVTESFYTDTNFNRKLFCHKYYNEKLGYLSQSRCYENGRLNGYMVNYTEKGDTISYSILRDNEFIKNWPEQGVNINGSADSIKIFERVEKDAMFPGGEAAWRKYIADNLEVPNTRKRIKGTMYYQFVVGKDGSIEDVQILKSLHPALDEEVRRIMRNSPKWLPAEQGGRKVKAYRKQPITVG